MNTPKFGAGFRRTAATAVAIAGVIALAACSGGSPNDTSATEEAQGDIVVGLNLELTGPGSFLGEGMKAGVEAAAEQINQAGGINGREISVISRDNQSDPSKAMTAVAELKREGAVAIIGPGFAQDCNAAAPAFAREDIVGFCLSASILPEDSSHMFGIGIDYAVMEAAFAEQYAAEGVKRVGLLAASDASGDDTVDNFVSVAEAQGITVDVERFNRPATDLSPQIISLMRNEPDALRLQATGPDALLGVTNVKTLGVTLDTWLPNSAASFYFASQVAGDVAAGNVLTWIPALLSETGAEDHPDQAEQIEGLLTALPEADTIVASGWDGMQVLARALAASESTDTADLIAALENMDMYYGAYSVQQITPDDHRGAVADGTLLPAYFTTEGTFTLRKAS